MKRLIGIGCLLLCATTWAADTWDEALADSVTTTIGEFRVERDAATDTYSVVLNGKVLVENRSAIGLSRLLKGKSQDFVLIFKDTGGTACGGTFIAVRIKSPVVLSEEFGNCAAKYRARVEGNRLVVTLPGFMPYGQMVALGVTPGSELVPAVIYTYVDGLLSMREVAK